MSPNALSLISQWTLPQGGSLLDRIERMVQPALLAGAFTQSATARVCGLQYHLGGAQDTAELAVLAGITPDDRVLDVCCFLGGPALQLVLDYGCHVTGIDINETVIAAARRIAGLAELENLLDYHVADARQIPFPDEFFSVVWCQASAAHDDAWLREFDRVLQLGGRLAMTIETRTPPHPWSLAAIAERMAAQGYALLRVDDVTARDIEIGWRSLDARLTADEAVYTAALGEAWVNEAHRQFADEAARMQAGEWGNGRIVARKDGEPFHPITASTYVNEVAGEQTRMDTLETMWEGSREYLRRMLISIVRDIDLAEDLLQETYLCASNGLSQYRGGSAQAWLAAIAKRCAFAHLRKAYVRAETLAQPDEDWPVGCSVGSHSHLDSLLLRKAMEGLSPALKETLLLKHYGGMSYPEIAVRLGCPVGTAKRRVWTAIRQLRSAMDLSTKEMRKMACSDINLLDYAYGILPKTECEELEEHLRSCEPCRTLVDDARRVIAGLDSVRDYESYTDITEIHADGTSTTHSCWRMDNKSSEPITKTEWCSMEYHTLKNVFLGGEEVPFEIAEPVLPNQRHYIARLPKPLAPGESIVSFIVFTTPPGVGAAFDIGYGRWVAVPDNSGTDSADHMLVQMVALPEGARLIGAIPEPQETRAGSRPTLVWKRVIPKGGEARERPVVVYALHHCSSMMGSS